MNFLVNLFFKTMIFIIKKLFVNNTDSIINQCYKYIVFLKRRAY